MIFLAALAMSGCSTEPPPGPAPLPAGSCHDDTLTTFVGQDATPEMGGTLMRQSGARVLRWVPKGSMITMEFSADRLTVYLDSNNRIEKLSCG
jgi:hypothetical protein